MRTRSWGLTLAVLISGLLLPSAARGQEPATSLSELPQWVRIGDRVTVTDASGRKLAGRIGGVKADAFLLVPDNAGRRPPTEFREGDVRTIARRDPDSLQNGALIGLGVGSGLFLLAVASSGGCGYDSGDCAAFVLIETAIFGGIGAGIGVGIDALVPGRERVIYRRSAGHATISIAPRLAPARQAVLFSIGF